MIWKLFLIKKVDTSPAVKTMNIGILFHFRQPFFNLLNSNLLFNNNYKFPINNKIAKYNYKVSKIKVVDDARNRCISII